MKAPIILFTGFLFAWVGQASSSVLSDLVATMKAKSFKPLNTLNALSVFRFGDLAEPVWAYSNGGSWDPLTNQLLMVGAPHGESMHFIRYQASDNAWRQDSMPPGNWGGAHTYDHLTIDTAGIFYHLYWSDGVAYRYDTRAGQWISPLSATTKGFGCLDYFPELNGLVRVVDGTISLYRFNTGAWQTVRSGLSMGTLEPIAQYCPAGKFLLFGGGFNDRRLFRLDTNLAITPLNDAPFVFDLLLTHLTADPVTGNLLMVCPDSIYEYNADSDHWSGIIKMPNIGIFSGHVGVFSIGTQGVIAITSISAWPVLLYKHAEPVSIEKAAPDEKFSKSGLSVYPNPFKISVSIRIDRLREKSGFVNLYDSRGRLVRQLNTTPHNTTSLVWDGRDLAGRPAAKGVYLAQIRDGGVTRSKIILKQQ